MKLESNESRLEGSWTSINGVPQQDATCQRIFELISTYFEKVATDDSGWESLYRDPHDGRYWECIYPHSEYHGGGPPLLQCLTEEMARQKYQF